MLLLHMSILSAVFRQVYFTAYLHLGINTLEHRSILQHVWYDDEPVAEHDHLRESFVHCHWDGHALHYVST